MNGNIILASFNKVWDTVIEALKKTGPWTLIMGVLYFFSKYDYFGIWNLHVKYISFILFVIFGVFLFCFFVSKIFLLIKSYIKYYHMKWILLKCSDEEKYLIACFYKNHKFKNISLMYYGYNKELIYNNLENKGIIVIKDNKEFDCTDLALLVLKKEGMKLFNNIYKEQENAKKLQHIHTITNELTASEINTIRAIDNFCKESSIIYLTENRYGVIPLVMLSRGFSNPKHRICISQTMQDLINQIKDNSDEYQTRSS